MRKRLASYLVTWFLVTPAGLPALEAPILAVGVDGMVSGDFGAWDFGANDVAWKAEAAEIWVLDAYAASTPFVSVFRASDPTLAPRRIPLSLPAAYATAKVLGIAEIPHGPLSGGNLVLVDPNFGTQGAPTPVFGLLDDDGIPVAGVSFAQPSGLVAGTRLQSIAVNPERDEIAAYAPLSHSVYLFDFNFSAIGGPYPLVGESPFYTVPWGFNGTLRGTGAGIAYVDADHIVAASSFADSFEVRHVLEYDLAQDFAYTGRALNLGGAEKLGAQPDLAFLPLDRGTYQGSPALWAVNLANEALYAFDFQWETDPSPVLLTTCALDGTTNRINLAWELPVLSAESGAGRDALGILENDVLVATLPPDATSWTSPWPVLGKLFVEVVPYREGTPSRLRTPCQIEEASVLLLPGVTSIAVYFNALADAGEFILGVAATKLPATPDDYRIYLVTSISNEIQVVDRTLQALAPLPLSPAVTSANGNLAAMGIALVSRSGIASLAILDADGTASDPAPTGSIYAIAPPRAGELLDGPWPIALTGMPAGLRFRDWDSDPRGGFVAGAVAADGRGYIVRIEESAATLTATRAVPLPQEGLSPFPSRPLAGVGVSVLPSGLLLIGAADAFHKTYTEALLASNFEEGSDPSFLGFAQGLIQANQFNGWNYGSDLGPDRLFALETAFFQVGTGGVGALLVPTTEIVLVRNPALPSTLSTSAPLLIQSQTRVAAPALVAEAMIDQTSTVPALGELVLGPVSPSFLRRTLARDIFVWIINLSTEDAVRLETSLTADGTVVADFPAAIELSAGRHYRAARYGTLESAVSLRLRNPSNAEATLRVIVGAMGLDQGEPPAASFRRGDCDADGTLGITNAVFGLNWLFKGGDPPPCPSACDTDDNGSVNLSDQILALNYLFRGGTPPSAPGPDACGEDPTPDGGFLEDCVYESAACE